MIFERANIEIVIALPIVKRNILGQTKKKKYQDEESPIGGCHLWFDYNSWLLAVLKSKIFPAVTGLIFTETAI